MGKSQQPEFIQQKEKHLSKFNGFLKTVFKVDEKQWQVTKRR